jgi:lipopolysaccharide transport system ATP-binding protein
MSIVIQAENLSKEYLISHQARGRSRYSSLRETLVNGVKNLFDRSQRPAREEFFALKDVSFKIEEGERVGIIGRNGAGKSTLLKILSRITEPSQGRVRIRGRVSSLLEVGTGFHPELTGRENIFLNGAILGMSRSEIKRKFDEIVSFSETEKFLDTPVKRFSSGMYVRLAFAVAAHLEPEIMLVDEVLAVGDAQFQKKCLGKMAEIGSQGRTILFVSHSMNAIERFCNRVIFLDQGTIKFDSTDVKTGISMYTFDQNDLSASVAEWKNDGSIKNPYFVPNAIYLSDTDGKKVAGLINNNSDVGVTISGEILQEDNALCIGYALYEETSQLLYWSYVTDSSENQWPKMKKGYCQFRCSIPKRLLNEGNYRIEMIGGLHSREWLFEPGKTKCIIHFQIRGGLSDSPYWITKRPGLIAPLMNWSYKYLGMEKRSTS